MMGAAAEQRMPMTQLPASRAGASPHDVEPKHWFPACISNFAYQDAQPRSAVSIHSSGLPVAARQVPQSAPKPSDSADNPNDRRQHGTEPVRFSNGQQLT
jgi:hypothetical protein